MINDQGHRVKEAGPSMPVEVIGFSKVPQVSAEFVCVDDEKIARNMRITGLEKSVSVSFPLLQRLPWNSCMRNQRRD